MYENSLCIENSSSWPYAEIIVNEHGRKWLTIIPFLSKYKISFI